jgi:hypothetical protein
MSQKRYLPEEIITKLHETEEPLAGIWSKSAQVPVSCGRRASGFSSPIVGSRLLLKRTELGIMRKA